jgi:hypothetical protein
VDELVLVHHVRVQQRQQAVQLQQRRAQLVGVVHIGAAQAQQGVAERVAQRLVDVGIEVEAGAVVMVISCEPASRNGVGPDDAQCSQPPAGGHRLDGPRRWAMALARAMARWAHTGKPPSGQSRSGGARGFTPPGTKTPDGAHVGLRRDITAQAA